jgi:hypothetical protein
MNVTVQQSVRELTLADQRRVRLISQAVRLTWRRGGLVWHRPLRVEVTNTAGTVQRIPIVDVTLCALLGMGLVGLALLAAGYLWQPHKRGEDDER